MTKTTGKICLGARYIIYDLQMILKHHKSLYSAELPAIYERYICISIYTFIEVQNVKSSDVFIWEERYTMMKI